MTLLTGCARDKFIAILCFVCVSFCAFFRYSFTHIESERTLSSLPFVVILLLSLFTFIFAFFFTHFLSLSSSTPPSPSHSPSYVSVVSHHSFCCRFCCCWCCCCLVPIQSAFHLNLLVLTMQKGILNSC